MINVTIDRKRALIEIESGGDYFINQIDTAADMLLDLFEKVLYSGEAVGLFVKKEDGTYEELERIGVPFGGRT